MNKKTKIVLGISSAVILLSVVFFALNKRKKNKEEREKLLKSIEEQKDLSAQELKELKAKLETSSEKEKVDLTEKLLTDIGNVKVGKFAYPKGASFNVRSSAMVNNGTINNILYENSKVKAGIIVKVLNSTEYGDKNKWYKVKLEKPFNGWTISTQYGYVRENVTTVKNM